LKITARASVNQQAEGQKVFVMQLQAMVSTSILIGEKTPGGPTAPGQF
jgi:hypothetical protein